MGYLQNSKFKNAIGKQFDYSLNFEFLDVVAYLMERLDENDYDDDNWVETYRIEEELILAEDQWTILHHYCSPSDANIRDAFDALSCDIKEIKDLYDGGIR